MNPNIYFLKPFKDKMLQAPAIWLWQRGIGANLVTTAGLAAGLGAAACIMRRQSGGALVLLGISVGADLLDGTIARLGKADKLSGKLYDALCDRVVELGWIGALIETGRLDFWGWLLGLGSILLLVCRCWAYQRRLDSSAVTVTRFERVVAILAVTLLPWRTGAWAFTFW